MPTLLTVIKNSAWRGTLATLVAGTLIFTALSIAPTFAKVALERKSDLKISTIGVEQDGMLAITIANHGLAEVAPQNWDGKTKIYLNDELRWTYRWSQIKDKSFLRAKGSTTLKPMRLKEGKYRVRACMDTDNIVEESNEQNNCLEHTVVYNIKPNPAPTPRPEPRPEPQPQPEPDPTLPDLIVDAIEVNAQGTVWTRLMNVGEQDIYTLEGYTYAYLDGHLQRTVSWREGNNWNFLKGEGGGETTIELFRITGTHTVRVCIDPTNVVTEGNEANNCLSANVSYGISEDEGDEEEENDEEEPNPEPNPEPTPPPASCDMADLAVRAIKRGEDNMLTIYVTNRGNADVENPDGRITIEIDGQLRWTYLWRLLANQEFLKSGQTSVLQPQVLMGEHTVKVCVDASNAVKESNEENNCLEVRLV